LLYFSRGEDERSRPCANRLISALDFVFTLEDIQRFIFLVMRMQWRAAPGRRRLRQHSERTIGLLPRDQKGYEVTQHIQMGSFARAEGDGLVASKERHSLLLK
jgi:hypothetical protein